MIALQVAERSWSPVTRFRLPGGRALWSRIESPVTSRGRLLRLSRSRSTVDGRWETVDTYVQPDTELIIMKEEES